MCDVAFSYTHALGKGMDIQTLARTWGVAVMKKPDVRGLASGDGIGRAYGAEGVWTMASAEHAYPVYVLPDKSR